MKYTLYGLWNLKNLKYLALNSKIHIDMIISNKHFDDYEYMNDISIEKFKDVLSISISYANHMGIICRILNLFPNLGDLYIKFRSNFEIHFMDWSLLKNYKNISSLHISVYHSSEITCKNSIMDLSKTNIKECFFDFHSSDNFNIILSPKQIRFSSSYGFKYVKCESEFLESFEMDFKMDFQILGNFSSRYDINFCNIKTLSFGRIIEDYNYTHLPKIEKLIIQDSSAPWSYKNLISFPKLKSLHLIFVWNGTFLLRKFIKEPLLSVTSLVIDGINIISIDLDGLLPNCNEIYKIYNNKTTKILRSNITL